MISGGDERDPSTCTPVRALIVLPSSNRDRFTESLLRHVDDEVAWIDAAVLDGGSGPLADVVVSHGHRIHSLGRHSRLGLVGATWRLRRLLQKGDYDVVHSASFFSAVVTEAARLLLPGAPPSILNRHHNRVHHLLGKRWHVRLDALMARRASLVVAISHAVKATLVEVEGVPASHVRVVHNGFDPGVVHRDDEAAARWRTQLPEGPLLVAAGRLDFQKDYPTLFRALARVVETHPSACLAIAGTGIPGALESLQADAASFGVLDHVRFLGWVDDVYALMQAGDVFVQTSVDEAFGQTVLEAAALAVPLAVTTPASVIEIVAGWHPYVAAGDDVRLAARITALLDGAGRQSDAEEAARVVLEQFGAERPAAGYIELYRELAVRPTNR